MSNFKNIEEYFSDSRLFVVPYYQRGYKWSLQKNTKRGDLHIILLLNDLISEFKNSLRENEIISNYEYYLQGITVKETKETIELVDGQQRTTSIFIMLCVLKQMGIDVKVNLVNKLKYDIREAANEVLQSFITGDVKGDESIQDIAALKKAWNLCYAKMSKIDNLQLFTEFLLKHIKIIYIKLDNLQDQAKVFSMMNKDKAEMTNTDLIKSNLLREASRQIYVNAKGLNQEGLEWQVNQVRSKLAIEWDNWRKWWENKEHLEFTRMISILSSNDNEPNLSNLLKLCRRQNQNNTLEFKNINIYEFYKYIIADRESDRIEAMEVFYELRLQQNILMEWYQNTSIYNYLGLIFKGCGLEDKEEILLNLIKEYKEKRINFDVKLKSIYKEKILKEASSEEFIELIANEKDAYHQMYTIVARQLLRMNVVRAINQKQKFNFSLYEENSYTADQIEIATKRSLEHIKPQTFISTGLHLSEIELEELNNLTNTIGNLVLIPRGINSKLSNKSFEDKRKIVFDELINIETNKNGLWLHTLSVFGTKNNWLIKEIEFNRQQFIEEAKTFYNN